MKKYLSFLYHQGIYSIRRSLLILLGISISISMISGITIYVSSVQNQYIQDQLYFIGDMSIYSAVYEQKYRGDQFFPTIETSNELVENLDFDFMANYNYEYHSFSQVVLYKNYSQLELIKPQGFDDFEYLPFYVASYQDSFYETTRFGEFFEIVEGTIPKSENDILIDYNSARKLQLEIGIRQNISVRFAYQDTPYIPDQSTASHFFEHDLENVNICGTYILKKEFIQFHFDTFETKLNTYIGVDPEEIPLINEEKLPILTTSNYKEGFFTANNSIRQLLTNIQMDMASVPQLNLPLMQQFFGKIYLYDRNIIRPSHLRTLVRKISREYSYLEYQLDYYFPNTPVRSMNNLGYLLRYVFEEFDAIRLQLYLFNIPIFFFAGIIGKNAFKTKVKSRKEEFLLFRSRGMNKLNINLLIIIESLFSSGFITILGTFGGFGFFSGFHGILNEYLGLPVMQNLEISLNLDLIIINLISSISLMFFSSIPVFVFVNRMSADKILESLGSDELDVEYDEKNLFKKKKQNLDVNQASGIDLSQKGKNSNINHPQSMKSLYNVISNDLEEKNLQSNLSDLKKNDITDTNIYQDVVKEKEFKLNLLSLLYYFLGILPLIPYFILIFSILPFSSDNLQLFADIIRINAEFVEFSTIIVAMFLPLGLIKVLLLNKPSRMARLARFLSNPFLGRKSHICGLEIIRRREFKNLIILLTIFSGMLCYANIFSITSTNQEIINDNLVIGADYRATLFKGDEILNLSNTQDFLDFQQLILTNDFQDSSYEIENILPVYQELIPARVANLTYKQFYTDIEDFKEVIIDKEKYVLKGDFESTLTNLINHNNEILQGNSVLKPKVIVNSKFSRVFQVNVGDGFTLYHEYLNSTSKVFSNDTIEVKIGAILDILPGIYQSGENEVDSYLFFDYNFFTQGDDLLISKVFDTMFDINIQKASFSEEDFIQSVLEASYAYFEFEEVQKYDYSWNDYRFKMASSGVPKIFSIVHFQMILIGILLAIGLSITILAFHEENKYFNGILLARGFGQMGLLKLIFSQIFFLFIVSFIAGLFSGLFFSAIFILMRRLLYPDLSLLNYILYFSPIPLFGIISLIIVLTFGIFFISFKLNSKKSKTRYFHQF